VGGKSEGGTGYIRMAGAKQAAVGAGFPGYRVLSESVCCARAVAADRTKPAEIR
jgi:hypothetical protein